MGRDLTSIQMKSLLMTTAVLLLLGFGQSYSIPDSIRPPEGCNHTALRHWLNLACYQLDWDNSLIRGKRSVYIINENDESEPTQKPDLYGYLLPHHTGHHSHHHSHHHHTSQNEKIKLDDKIIEFLLEKMRTENGRQKRRLYFTDDSISKSLKDKCCRDECFIEDLRLNC